MFGMFGIMFTLVFLLVMGVFVTTAVRGLRQWNRNNHSPRLTVPATVVAKRTNVSHHHHSAGVHQLALRAVAVEYGFGQVRRLTSHKVLWLGGVSDLLSPLALCLGKDCDNLLDLGRGSNLVEGNAYAELRRIVEVDMVLLGNRLHNRSLSLDIERVEVVCICEFVAQSLDALSCGLGSKVGGQSGTAQALCAIIDAVEAHNRSHQSRCGTDIRGCALALDVLLAHLQRHTQGTTTEAVYRHTDNTTWHIAFESLLRSHIARRRTSKAHWATETLSRAYSDIGTPLCWRGKQRQREQVGIGSYQCAHRVCRSHEVRVVANLAISRRILYDSAELLAREGVVGIVVHDKFDAEWLTAGEQYIESLREDILIHKEDISALLHRLARTEREHHSHSLGYGSALVEQ